MRLIGQHYKRDYEALFGPLSDLDRLPKDAGPLRDARTAASLGGMDHGAFNVPSLRNVAARAPYMHAGQPGSLDEVVRHYSKAPPAAAGHSEFKPIGLTDGEIRHPVAFLGALSSETVEAGR